MSRVLVGAGACAGTAGRRELAMRVAACVVLAVLVAGCDKGVPSPASREKEKPAPEVKPLATFPPDDWTHKELAEHLGKKGVKVTVESAPLFNKPGQTLAVFTAGSEADRGKVGVYLCADAKMARELAGSMGGEAFAKNRFAIGTGNDPNRFDRELLGKISDALK
jgi:hypothetical protein